MNPPEPLDPSGERAEAIERELVREESRVRLFGGPARPVRLGRFEIRGRLGAGAMGTVYAAFDPELQRDVAIKVLAASPRGEVVLREARALARLSHPNVLPIFEVGAARGTAFIVSELVRGGTLRAWSSAERRPTSVVLDVLQRLGRALAFGHAQGLVHLDVKPDNVLMDTGGSPRLCDYGLASLGAVGARGDSRPLPGTPRYMAPEQLRGERADALSDQFSFAVTAVEALTGVAPFTGESVSELLESMRRGPRGDTADPAGRAALRVLRRALSMDPSGRYPSMEALLTDLPDGSAAIRGAGTGRRLGLVVLLGGALVVAAVAVAGWAWQAGSRRSTVDEAATDETETESAPQPSARADSEISISKEATVLTKEGRWDDCARYLAPRADTAALVLMWISCAEAGTDADQLARACTAWNGLSDRKTSAHTPELCGAPLPEARKLYQAKQYRACADLILAAPATRYGTVQLTRCSAQLRDPAVYRRVCEYQQSLEPPESRVSCARITDVQ